MRARLDAVETKGRLQQALATRRAARDVRRNGGGVV